MLSLLLFAPSIAECFGVDRRSAATWAELLGGRLLKRRRGVGPAVDQRAVEPRALAVGLGPVGPGPFVCDVRLWARVPPGLGQVAGAVVRQDMRSTVTPRSANQATARWRTLVAVSGLLVGADLGVRDPEVVVYDGVQVADTGSGFTSVVPLAGAFGGDLPVSCPADGRPGVRLLGAPDGLRCDPVDVAEPMTRLRPVRC